MVRGNIFMVNWLTGDAHHQTHVVLTPFFTTQTVSSPLTHLHSPRIPRQLNNYPEISLSNVLNTLNTPYLILLVHRDVFSL